MKTVRVSRIYEYPDDLEDEKAIDNALDVFGKKAPYFLEYIRDFVSAKILTKKEKDESSIKF